LRGREYRGKNASGRVPPSAAIRRLLFAPLDSFEKLEVVVALYRASAHTSSVAALAKLCELSPDITSRTIDELARAGFVEGAEGLTRLTAGTEDLAAIGELVAVYDDDRIVIVRALSEISMDKIRRMAARTFADAFNLRKKREDDGG